MANPNLNNGFAIVLTGIIAFVGYGNAGLPLWVHCVVILMPVFWVATHTRLGGGAVLFTYHAIASRGLIEGSAVFLDLPLWLGFVCWVAFSVAAFLAGVMCWHPELHKRRYRLIVLLLVMLIPPFGLFITGHPLLATGLLLPNWGWWGFLVVFLLLILLSIKPLRFSLLSIMPLLGAAYYANSNPLSIEGWQGHDTYFSLYAADYQASYMKDFERFQVIESKLQKEAVHVFPETIAGEWTRTAQRYWTGVMQQPRHRNQTVLMGAVVNRKQGGYYNTVVKANRQGANVVYRQRYPIPIGMWRPWQDDGAKPYFDEFGVIELEGKRLGILICYEAFLMVALLERLIQQPDGLVVISNLWWSTESILIINEQVTTSMSRLFNVPLIRAVNKGQT